MEDQSVPMGWAFPIDEDSVLHVPVNPTSSHETVILNLNTQKNDLQTDFDEAMEMLDNVRYWETCPDDYKERIKKLRDKHGLSEND